MQKEIGKIMLTLEDKDGIGTYIRFSPGQLKRLGFNIGDWVKYIGNDDGTVTLEKASNDEVLHYLDPC